MKWTASFAATATDERLRIGVADVLGREAHQPPRDVQRILAGLEHARQPVDRRVGIAVAHRLVQRRDQVVVLLAASCRRGARGAGCVCSTLRQVERRTPSPAGAAAPRTRAGSARRARRRWRTARCAASASSVAVDRHRAEPALARRSSARRRMRRRPRRSSSGLQHEHLRARQQRRVDLERRVLGRRADQHDVAGLDARQERVLLRLVEAVDLVDEDDRAAARSRGAPSRPSAITSRISLMPASTALNGTKCALRRVGDDARERRLAGAGRPPQDDRLQQVALDRRAQRPSRPEERSWPTTSSSVRGRMRSASGADARGPAPPRVERSSSGTP